MQRSGSRLTGTRPTGFLKEGCELINEALNLFNNVYGAMHVEICACLRLLARLNYIMGDHPEVGHSAAAIVGNACTTFRLA